MHFVDFFPVNKNSFVLFYVVIKVSENIATTMQKKKKDILTDEYHFY